MIQSNYYHDNDPLKDHVEHLIDWKEVIDLYENGFADAEDYKRAKDLLFEMAPSIPVKPETPMETPRAQ